MSDNRFWFKEKQHRLSVMKVFVRGRFTFRDFEKRPHVFFKKRTVPFLSDCVCFPATAADILNMIFLLPPSDFFLQSRAVKS